MVDYGTVDRCTGGASTESGHYGSHAVAKAFDDLLDGEYWQHNIAAPNGWIKYDFGVGKTWVIAKITMIGNIAAFGSTYGTKVFTVYGSNNDSTWDTLGTMTDNESAGVQTFTFTNKVAYRYIKLISTTNGTGGNAGTTEIAMFEQLFPSGGILAWFFSQSWTKHDKLWRNNKLYLPKDLSFQM